MWTKVIAEGSDAQRRFLEGVEVVDRMVGNTLGIGGRNRLIQQKYKAPWVVNDGAQIARRIVVEDEIADLAAQVIIEVAMKTGDQAGDGTTTSVVLASELTRHCMTLLKEDSERSELEGKKTLNAMDMKRQIHLEKEKAIASLKKSSHSLSDTDLENVIATSIENLEYGSTLADLIKTVGQDGYISVDDNWATKYGITTEVTTGMKFLGTYASPYLANESNAKEALWEDTHVLVTNQKIETASVLKNLIAEFNEKGVRKLVIINGTEASNPYSQQFVKAVANGVLQAVKGNDNAIQILAVKAQSLTTPELEDVAVFCGANFFDKNLGREISTVRLQDLGFAKKVSVTEDDVNILGGTGETDIRIGVLKEQVEREKDAMYQEKLKVKIASLS